MIYLKENSLWSVSSVALLRMILWRAVQLKVTYLLVSILVFGLLNAKVASVLAKSIFFLL